MRWTALQARGAAGLPPKKRRAQRDQTNQKPASEIEALFDIQLRADKIGGYQRNYMWHPERNFEFDRAWPEWKFAIEIEGMAHRIKERFESDVEKYALAQLHGWTVMRVSGRAIRDGRAIQWVRQFMEGCRWLPPIKSS